MFCSKCGAENEDNAIFCNVCGEKFNNSSQKDEKCPNCGANVQDSLNYCEKCGAQLNNNTNTNYQSTIHHRNRETKFDLRTLLIASVVVAITYVTLEIISSTVTYDYYVLINLLYLYCLIAGLLAGFLFNRLNTLEHNYINNVLFSVLGLIMIMLYYGLTGGEVGNLGTQVTNLILILVGSFIGSYLERNAIY